jgi:hypothetical protein
MSRSNRNQYLAGGKKRSGLTNYKRAIVPPIVTLVSVASADVANAQAVHNLLRNEVMYQGNIRNGYCHDYTCTQGSNTTNYWSIDLFDYGAEDSPIYETQGGIVQNVDGCGTAVRTGNVASGAGYGKLYCHGKNRQVNKDNYVAAGQVLMKMSNSGTGTKHVHYEIRKMSDVRTWGNNFQGFCSNYNLITIRDQNTFGLLKAWSEPDNTFTSSCRW